MVETKTAIVGNRRAVMQYCDEHKINPRDKDYILVHGIENLRGYHCRIKDIWVGPPLSLTAEIEIYQEIRRLNAMYAWNIDP
jgi:hypothetical protein